MSPMAALESWILCTCTEMSSQSLPPHHARPLVHPQVQDMRENLNEDWVWFQRVLIDSELMLQENKEKFKSSLIQSSQEFKEKIQTALEEFNKTGHTHIRINHIVIYTKPL